MDDTRQVEAGSPHWRRNLYVCLFGSFTTLAAMTLLVPFLPIYVAQLGVTSQADIVQWSGIAFAATFFGAGLVAPLWGKFADRYGRRLILIRASFCMAIAMAMLGTVQNVWQLTAVRLLAGLLGGYASGATVLVATQTPRDRAGWALGTLSTGVLAGSLLGPLIGGVLPPLIGVRGTFFLAGGVIFVAFIATCLLIREDAPPQAVTRDAPPGRMGGDPGQTADRRHARHRHAADGRQHVHRADHHRLCGRTRPWRERDAGRGVRDGRLGAGQHSRRRAPGAARGQGGRMERDHAVPADRRPAAGPAGLRHRCLAASGAAAADGGWRWPG